MESITSQEYEFTADWFSDHIPVFDQLINHFKPRRLLEIGSFEGRSTCYFIEKCSDAHAIEICCIDTWEGGVEHNKNTMPDVKRRFDHNVRIAMKRAPNAVSVQTFRKPSVRALAEIIASDAAPFDFIYVDGSHRAPDVLADAVFSFELLRVGGLIVFDNYLWSMEPLGQQDPLNMPKPAIDAFINLFQRKVRVIDGPPIYQLYVEKLSP